MGVGTNRKATLEAGYIWFTHCNPSSLIHIFTNFLRSISFETEA